ncbi:hypothetical protein C8R43DRAFT_964090 [Mycena crocata]|nr:hypothetical protein C8R43DRAFT_964090 [Mycena crocata]
MESQSHDPSSVVSYSLSPPTNRLFEENTPALDTQVLEIRESIAAAETDRALLALEIASAKAELRCLERRDKDAMLHIERCTSVVAGVRRLPPEILSRVFVLVRDACFKPLTAASDLGRSIHNKEVEPSFAAGSILELGHVCSYWRNVALGTRELWSRFLFRCPGKAAKGQTVWHAWMERVGNHPLSFSFSCPGHYKKNLSPDLSPIGSSCRDFLETLLSSSARWQNVHLSLSRAALKRLKSVKHLPLLETLHLQIKRPWHGSKPRPLIISTFAVAPKLHEVRLPEYLEKVTIELPWSQLTNYCGAPTNPDGRAVLDLARNITALTLVGDQRLTQPLTHRLRHIHYISGEEALDRLVLPALDSFHLERTRSMGMDRVYPSITQLFQRSGNALTQLHVDGFRPEDRFAAILAATPSLTSLTLVCEENDYRLADSSEATNSFFAKFNPPQGDPLIPLLRQLTITGLTTMNGFLLMVDARSIAAPTTARLEMLEILGVKLDTDNYEVVTRRLQKLRDGGMNMTLGIRKQRSFLNFDDFPMGIHQRSRQWYI